MENELRQFYRDVRLGAKSEAILLTPRELLLKAAITKCIQSLTDASNNELLHLIQVLRAEGLQISEPSIRHDKFVAAAVVTAFEPLSLMFRKL